MNEDLPIIFSAPMVRAILNGRKTQTRRVIKEKLMRGEGAHVNNCPYGKPGDRLWVRETWQGPLFYDEIPEDWNSDKYKTPEYCYYKASGDSCDFTDADDNFVERWSPSIFMPRWASRITLEVVNVRVERLQDISAADSLAEGVKVHPDHHGKPRNSIYSPVQAYADLWESINGKGSWDLNPLVWVIEFKVISK